MVIDIPELGELQPILRQVFGPRPDIVDASRMTSGTINRTWNVALSNNERVIVRIGPSDETAAAGPSWLTSFGLRREQDAIRLLESSIDLLPVTLASDFTRTVATGDWVVQEVMPGRAWSAIFPSLTLASQLDLWRQLGAIVSKIHAVAGDAFGPPSFGSTFSTWPELVRSDLAGLLSDARIYGVPDSPIEVLRDLVTRHDRELAPVRPCLIHSDLSLDHVFIDRIDDQWSVSGLIDFEFSRFADPISEGLLLGMLERPDQEPEREAFLGGYGLMSELSGIRLDVSRLLNQAWRLKDEARHLGSA